MALDTYTTLVSAIASWATRTDSVFAARVPDFIRLAEERIWRRLRVSEMVTLPEVLTIPAGLFYVDLPEDFLAFKRIGTAAEPRLDYMPPDSLYDLPLPGDARAYSIEGRRLLYGMTPSAPLDITVRYYAAPEPLSEATASNWLLLRYPSIYLYGSLLEAYVWAKNPQKVAEYGKLFDDAIVAAEDADKVAMISGSTLRMRRA